MKNKVLFLVGPTAVGKTDLSLDMAEKLNGEIISADSVQIFKSLNIGSAKPTMEEQRGVKHHLIDFLDPQSTFSVAEYRKQAKSIISDILSRGKTPIVAGGTGLYINALIYDMDFGEVVSDPHYRLKLEATAEEKGAEYLHDQLKALDPEAAEKIHFNNVRRVVRALEVNHITGKPMKDFSKDPQKTQDYETILVGLTRARMKLYGRINQRVDLMLEAGLIEEVEALKNQGLDDRFQSMQGIGYKEVLGFLSGKYEKDVMVSLLKQNTRRYAKRQLTWFKRYEEIHWLALDQVKSPEERLDFVLRLMGE